MNFQNMIMASTAIIGNNIKNEAIKEKELAEQRAAEQDALQDETQTTDGGFDGDNPANKEKLTDKIMKYASPLFDPANIMAVVQAGIVEEHENKEPNRRKLNACKGRLLKQAKQTNVDALNEFTTGVCNRSNDTTIVANVGAILEEVVPGAIKSVLGGKTQEELQDETQTTDAGADDNPYAKKSLFDSVLGGLSSLAGAIDVGAAVSNLEIDLSGKKPKIGGDFNLSAAVDVNKVMDVGGSALGKLDSGLGISSGLSKVLGIDVKQVATDIGKDIQSGLNVTTVLGVAGDLGKDGKKVKFKDVFAEINPIALGAAAEKTLGAALTVLGNGGSAALDVMSKITPEPVKDFGKSIWDGAVKTKDKISEATGIGLKDIAEATTIIVASNNPEMFNDLSGSMPEMAANVFVKNAADSTKDKADSSGFLSTITGAALSFTGFLSEGDNTPDSAKGTAGKEPIAAAVSVASLVKGVCDSVAENSALTGNTEALVNAIASQPVNDDLTDYRIRSCCKNCKQSGSNLQNILAIASATGTELDTVTGKDIKTPDNKTNVVDGKEPEKTDTTGVVDNVYDLVEFGKTVKNGDVFSKVILGVEVFKKCAALIPKKEQSVQDIYGGFNPEEMLYANTTA